MRRDLQYMIGVMAAANAGAVIEFTEIGGMWRVNNTPSWNWTVYDYRIAPEPRRPRMWHVWVDSKNKLSSSQPDDFHQELITVREVLEEDK